MEQRIIPTRSTQQRNKNAGRAGTKTQKPIHNMNTERPNHHMDTIKQKAFFSSTVTHNTT